MAKKLVMLASLDGNTVQEAEVNAEKALQGDLTLPLEGGEALPAVTRIDDIARDPDVDEATRVLVRFDLSGRSTCVTPLKSVLPALR